MKALYIPCSVIEPMQMVDITDWRSMNALIGCDVGSTYGIFIEGIKHMLWLDDRGNSMNQEVNYRASLIAKETLVGSILVFLTDAQGETVDMADGVMARLTKEHEVRPSTSERLYHA